MTEKRNGFHQMLKGRGWGKITRSGVLVLPVYQDTCENFAKYPQKADTNILALMCNDTNNFC